MVAMPGVLFGLFEICNRVNTTPRERRSEAMEERPGTRISALDAYARNEYARQWRTRALQHSFACCRRCASSYFAVSSVQHQRTQLTTERLKALLSGKLRQHGVWEHIIVLSAGQISVPARERMRRRLLVELRGSTYDDAHPAR